MRRRPYNNNEHSVPIVKSIEKTSRNIGLVLSGGGSRAAYQVGALKALVDYIEGSGDPISVIIGSSIGAVNGLVLAASLKNGYAESVSELESVWRERTFRNTFHGSPSRTFLRALKMAFLRYRKDASPKGSAESIFDPRPLMERVDSVINAHGGLSAENRAPHLKAVGVMTTIEGVERKPLLFLSSRQDLSAEDLEGASFQVQSVRELSAKHGLASAALPTVLPPVELDVEGGKVSLVDGGISQNIPVDPAVRLGADRVIIVDISGRDWWLRRYGQEQDQRPDWEVEAGLKTYCVRPPETFIARCQKPLGPILKASVAQSTAKFISALGVTWPIFSLIKNRLGEELAYEIMSYVALHPEYADALIETGYNETIATLNKKHEVDFKRPESYSDLLASLQK